MVSGFLDGLWIKTDNTAYQALVLVWLWCGKTMASFASSATTCGARKHAWTNINNISSSSGMLGGCYFPSRQVYKEFELFICGGVIIIICLADLVSFCLS